MGMTIISRRERVEAYTYRLSFDRIERDGSGFGFDCDEHGNLLGNEFATKERRELQAAELRLDPGFFAPYISKWNASYTNCAVGRCTCGAEVQLEDPLFNQCDRCHRYWNICGQEKIDPNGALNRELDIEAGEFYGIDY
jgi:hypothetical protein